MISAIVRYRLPVSSDHDACLVHFAKVAPGFRSAKGLISKHFIWGKHGIAGGGYLEGTVEVLGTPRRQALETSLQK